MSLKPQKLHSIEGRGQLSSVLNVSSLKPVGLSYQSSLEYLARGRTKSNLSGAVYKKRADAKLRKF